MHPKPPKILLHFTFLGLLLPGLGAWAVPEPSVDLSGDLEKGIAAWIVALESRSDQEQVWEFPFAAPKPRDLTEMDLALVLSLRHLVRTLDLPVLESEVDKVARRTDLLPAQMQFWLAYSLHLLDRHQACLTRLESLLRQSGTWRDLEGGQLVWVLTTTADIQFLTGNRHGARYLYTHLADSSVAHLNLWGNYQLAGAELLARDFVEADRRYRLVCESETSGNWREHACEMAAIAGRLANLRTEGTGNGNAANVGP